MERNLRKTRVGKVVSDKMDKTAREFMEKCRPILIIDEPQSVEGRQTRESLRKFNALFTLRYSATHREAYNMVYRLDALDAYNRHLVKRIAALGVTFTSSPAAALSIWRAWT